jgi:hypothetical protein
MRTQEHSTSTPTSTASPFPDKSARQKALENAQLILKERALFKVQLQVKEYAQRQTLLRIQDLKKLVEQQGLKMKVHQELTQQTVA